MKKLLLFFVFISYGLVAQTPIYEFNFNNSVADGSGINFFTLMNATTTEFGNDRFGNPNSSLKVPTVTIGVPYYEANLINLPQGNTARTVSIWVSYPIESSDSQIRIFQYGANTTNNTFGLLQYGGQSTPYVRAFGWANDADSPQGPVYGYINNSNAWYHYIMTYDGTDVKVYRNGILMVSSPKPTWNTSGTSFRLNQGSNFTGINNKSVLFDDLKIYDIALTEAQVKQMYVDEVAFNSTDLVAYYGFENNLDCSNNSNLNLSVNNPSPTPFLTGVIGMARKIEYGPLFHNTLGSLIDKSEFSIMLWEKQNSFEPEPFASLYEWGGSHYLRRRTNPTVVDIGYASNPTNWSSQTRFTNPLSTWTHHAVTLKVVNGNVRMLYYRNGELWNEIPSIVNTALIHTFNDKFVIGGGLDAGGNLSNQKNLINSEIDEFYIYNRELHQSEILATIYRTTAPTFTSCPTGSVTLTTQAEVDALASCTTINGQLNINAGGAVLDLTPLNNITTITGSLSVENLGNTGNLSLLNSITNIGGAVMFNNLSATSISGFDNINTLLGLATNFCNNLVSFDAFTNLNQLTSGSWNLQFAHCPLLSSISGLSNLTQVTNINIVNCPSLTSLNFLNSLTTYTSSTVRIALSNNLNLIDISALNGVSGQPITELVITDNLSLSTCAVDWVCDYLATASPNATISGNATGCESVAAVNSACAALSNSDFDLASISLYPNPTDAIFSIEIPNEVVKQVRIFDVTGKMLLDSNQATLNV
ncbi:MAG: hypothetical protein IE891_04270, partial [Flavobacteriaceae bacterium]|nr:hypothetical protein [Flavobacteriaceae bacterium]